ncbi:MAG: hypothetical protein ACI9R3_001011 [Verrucomicrobiales bacterium]|jgi:hypothetical protein
MKSLRKSIAVALVGIGLLPFSAKAAITFNFTFAADVTTQAEWVSHPDAANRQAALASAAALTGSFFVSSGTVDVSVAGTNVNSATLASAGSFFSGPFTPGFGNRGSAGSNVINNNNSNGAAFDANVQTNWFHTWDLDDSVAPGSFDYKAVMIHEFAHALGFAGAGINAAGDSFLGPTFRTPYDEFISDGTTALINAAGVVQPGYSTKSVEGTGAVPSNSVGMYWNGTNAVAANGGNPVPLYTPTTYSGGSSVSHLDTDWYDGSAAGRETKNMNHAVGTGPGNRGFSPIELGMWQDLGFTVVPEPSSATLILLAFTGLVVRRRR